MTVEILPKRQAEVLAYILECWNNGWVPNHRCISEHFSCAWGTTWKHVRALRAKGYLRIDARKPLRLTKKSLELVT